MYVIIIVINIYSPNDRKGSIMNTTDYDSMYPYTGGNQYSTKFWENFVYVTTHKYADFHGRASRGEFWRYTLVVFLISAILPLLAMAIFSDGVGDALSVIISIALFLPSLALSVRRLHDIDKSGWWILIQIIPLLGGLYLLYCNVRRGDPQANRFGPNPIPEE